MSYLIDIYSSMFKCTCGHIFRATFTFEEDNKTYKMFMPRKCEKCGRLNREGYHEL